MLGSNSVSGPIATAPGTVVEVVRDAREVLAQTSQPEITMKSVAIGLRAKTARAIAIIVGGEASAPIALRQAELEFATAKTPATFQPYHEVMDQPWERAQLSAQKAETELAATAGAALRDLVERLSSEGSRVCAVGIVGAPARRLERIGSPHIRAHAAEGVLFRRILELGADANGLPWYSFAEKGIEDLAVQQLGIARDTINLTLVEFGCALGRPWRADEKQAALGAWLALAQLSAA